MCRFVLAFKSSEFGKKVLRVANLKTLWLNVKHLRVVSYYGNWIFEFHFRLATSYIGHLQRILEDDDDNNSADSCTSNENTEESRTPPILGLVRQMNTLINETLI